MNEEIQEEDREFEEIKKRCFREEETYTKLKMTLEEIWGLKWAS